MKKFIVFALIAIGVLSIVFFYKGDYNLLKKDTKTIVLGVGSEPITLDPAYAMDIESAKVIVNLYDGLVKYKEDSIEVEPALATSWKISNDGKEYVFYLRQGVKFHDGTVFNAYAVKFNIERQLQKGDQKACFKEIFKYISELKIIDDYTIKFVLSQPNPAFLKKLAIPYAAPIVSPKAIKKYGDKLFNHPVGTGAFKFVKWNKGESIILKRNKQYWGEKAKVNNIVIKFIKKNSQKVDKFITKNVDIVDNLDSNSVMDIEKNGGKILQQSCKNINYIGFNYLKSPFNNCKMRKVVCEAINREEIIKRLYQGYSSKIQDGILYNPHKSSKTLDKLEQKNLKMIVYSNTTSYNNVGEKLAEYIQKNLLDVGIKANIEVLPWDKYIEKIKSGNWDIMFFGALEGNIFDEIEEKLKDNNVIFPICNSKIIAAYKNGILDFKYHQTGVIFFNKIRIR